MKKFLFIAVVLPLLIITWSVFSPNSFLNFFKVYPIIDNIASQTNSKIEESPEATTSEPISVQAGQVNIGKATWSVEIANNDQDRINGLSNRKVLASEEGMLFVFDSMSKQSFWMKDMLFPIDMIFFDDNKRVVLIESNLQPNSYPKIFGTGVKSEYVLEINAGESLIYGLQVGDQAIFTNK